MTEQTIYESDTPEELGKLLGLSDEETELMKLRADILIKITNAMKDSKLTHQELAKKLNTSRTRITRIFNGKEEHITFDFLLKILYALGYKTNLEFAKIA
ncbi:MAG: helix-turn-helix domain-containing protein [Spirochaetia bacterium]|nr:helix-turn-helix domain-containing protein [Spirochaetia bacterium]